MKKILLLLSLMAAGVQAAPSLDHQVFNAQNQAVSLSEFKGKVVYVDFGPLGVGLAVNPFRG